MMRKNSKFVSLAAGIVVVFTILIILVFFFSSKPTQGNIVESDQSRIVFSGIINTTTHQIFSVDQNGIRLVNLTSWSDVWHFEPIASPDGSKVAYETWNGFPNPPIGTKIIQHLYVVDSDGTNRARLTPDNGIITSSIFSWSRDSRKIAYESSEDIYVVDADGSNRVRLTNDKESKSEGHRVSNINPFWSKNDTIIFTTYAFEGPKIVSGEFRAINPEAPGLLHLFNFDPDRDWRWKWSNNRESIAYLRAIDDNEISLYLSDASNQHQRLLTSFSDFYIISDLGWSPDDKKIAFVGIESSGSFASGAIFIVDVLSGNYQKLPGTESLTTTPVWSPDGTQIAFMKTISQEAISLNAVDIRSGEVKQIAQIGQSIATEPIDWMPLPSDFVR